MSGIVVYFYILYKENDMIMVDFVFVGFDFV